MADKPTILVVDDEVRLLQALRSVLVGEFNVFW